jgi:hypothetical protein
MRRSLGGGRINCSALQPDMRKLIGARLAGNVLLAALGMLSAFHVLVLLEILPSTIVWAGRIGGSTADLVALETVSLIVTLLFAVIIAAKMGYIKVGRLKRVIDILVWVVFAYTLLSVVANLASPVFFENTVLAPVSLLLSLLVLRVAIQK